MIRISTFSEAGGHPANEDAFLVREVADRPGRWVAALQAAARLPRSGQFQDDFTAVLIEAG